jgi:DNA repair photolyase
MNFWSINPYVGCEFGCTYCYARDTHRWTLERAPAHDGAEGEDPSGPASPRLPAWLAFEKLILVKSEAADVLGRGFAPARVAGSSIVIGTATDPYQPAEKRFGITRRILERFLGYEGLTLVLITKSPLVTRDVDLLVRLGARHEVNVNISLASLDRHLVRRLEARSPAPAARIRALEALTRAGVHAGLLVAPVVPGVTDGREALRALLRAGKEAGARYAFGSALRLGSAARARFLPHLAREFPGLRERYERRYGASQGPGRDYEAALARRFRSLQQELGYPIEEGRRQKMRVSGGGQRSGGSPGRHLRERADIGPGSVAP